MNPIRVSPLMTAMPCEWPGGCDRPEQQPAENALVGPGGAIALCPYHIGLALCGFVAMMPRTRSQVNAPDPRAQGGEYAEA